jgi:hypothetical protein
MPEIFDHSGAPLRHGRPRVNGLGRGSTNKGNVQFGTYLFGGSGCHQRRKQ